MIEQAKIIKLCGYKRGRNQTGKPNERLKISEL